jgi:hypothetical protein
VNNLTRKYIDDFLPYLKPERRDGHKRRTLEDVTRCGEIVRIEDMHSDDGKRILERTYYHENGARGVLCASQAGVASLPA